MDWSTADRIAMVNVLATGKTYYVGLANVTGGNDPWTTRTDIPLTRQAMTMPAATSTPTVANGAKLTWPPVSTDQPDATHIVLWDALTGGAVRAVKALTAPKPLPAGTICSINAGTIATTQS